MDLAALPEALKTRLTKLGLLRPFDLVLHLPLRYEDETHLYPMRDAPMGQSVLLEGTVESCEVQYKPRKQLIARVSDASGTISVRLLNFYPSVAKQLAVGKTVRLYGEIRRGFLGDEMVHPKIRAANEQGLNEALTPIYPTTAGLNQLQLAKLIRLALKHCNLADTLPERVLGPLDLPDFSSSVQLLHAPTPDIPNILLTERTHPAWQRLKFDELLAQQLSLRTAHAARRERTAPVIAPKGELAASLLASLPFALTGAQGKVLKEITHDLNQPHPCLLITSRCV